MQSDVLNNLYEDILKHRSEHACGGYPYQHGSMLTALSASLKPSRILELGTGLGYGALCLALGAPTSKIDTIDQDDSHITDAKKNWELFSVHERIHSYHGKAEAILPTLETSYDIIFFDGYAPSLKFLIHFERLLKKDGVLLTANLFVKDPAGGRYVRQLNDKKRWTTGYFADTALSVKNI